MAKLTSPPEEAEPGDIVEAGEVMSAPVDAGGVPIGATAYSEEAAAKAAAKAAAEAAAESSSAAAAAASAAAAAAAAAA
eukprot:CAMPEP_0204112562 /NCGR_PEP_ID=MMETSP0361-20130328/3128_1 /ASSEMBLY_ACC=CAM_ASM_000343 /TAXON_ID=268821 /ORGANISM="Scrippsiella Hangoei, Strain SHTV-5" /LENGTH=78 /DNA_ID=CAMNT_0051062793 /DNA_START=430 /DNA_END=664 /DNA_ORIENTATION=-